MTTRLVLKHNRKEIWEGDKLVGLEGRNINGEFGVWYDSAAGLCEHERVRVHCNDCSPALPTSNSIVDRMYSLYLTALDEQNKNIGVRKRVMAMAYARKMRERSRTDIERLVLASKKSAYEDIARKRGTMFSVRRYAKSRIKKLEQQLEGNNRDER